MNHFVEYLTGKLNIDRPTAQRLQTEISRDVKGFVTALCQQWPQAASIAAQQGQEHAGQASGS